MKKINIKDLIICSMFSSLIALGAFIKIPLFLIPFTMQVFFVLLSSINQKKMFSFLSVFIYILIGLMGLPIFSEGGGMSYFLKPTFGYLLGMLISSILISSLLEKCKFTFRNIMIISIIAVLLIYIIGTLYCYIISKYYLETNLGFKTLIIYCFLSTIIGDIISTILASIISLRLKNILKNDE